jgi:hypothetical protein
LATDTPHLILNYVLGTQGYPWAAWRHPASDVERVTHLDYYVEQAEIAERGCFDMVFLVDHLAHFPDPEAPLFWPLDPMLLVTRTVTSTSLSRRTTSGRSMSTQASNSWPSTSCPRTPRSSTTTSPERSSRKPA